MNTTAMTADQPVASPYKLVIVRTYRYLRLGIVGLVLFLAISLVIEIQKSGWDLLASISAYYYTPVHSVFVASLCAVGVALVVYRGFSETEDVILNAAGFLVFVVALVPTSRSSDDLANASSILEVPRSTILANLGALLLITFVSIIATWLLISRRAPASDLDEAEQQDQRRARIAFYVLVFGYFVVVVIFFFFHSFIFSRGHLSAAIGFFAAIVLVVGINAVRWARQTNPEEPLRRRNLLNRYGAVFVAMLVTAITIFVLGEKWSKNWVFWLEASLILLFALYWALQTAEHWEDLLTAVATAPGEPPGPIVDDDGTPPQGSKVATAPGGPPGPIVDSGGTPPQGSNKGDAE